jgi:hypothetical protein
MRRSTGPELEKMQSIFDLRRVRSSSVPTLSGRSPAAMAPPKTIPARRERGCTRPAEYSPAACIRGAYTSPLMYRPPGGTNRSGCTTVP